MPELPAFSGKIQTNNIFSFQGFICAAGSSIYLVNNICILLGPTNADLDEKVDIDQEAEAMVEDTKGIRKTLYSSL